MALKYTDIFIERPSKIPKLGFEKIQSGNHVLVFVFDGAPRR
jgi:hypothetical protein